MIAEWFSVEVFLWFNTIETCVYVSCLLVNNIPGDHVYAHWLSLLRHRSLTAYTRVAYHWKRERLNSLLKVKLEALADNLPDHQARTQDTALHMKYHKGGRLDLSTVCMSLFFVFSWVFVITVKNQSIDFFPSASTLLMFTLCGLPPPENSCRVLWFSGLGVQTQCSHSLSLVLLNTKLLRKLCVLLWWLVAPPPFPKPPHVLQMSVERDERWGCIILGTPRPPQWNIKSP